jgi:hypothetical protein
VEIAGPRHVESEIKALDIAGSLADAALLEATPAERRRVADRLRASLPGYVDAIARHQKLMDEKGDGGLTAPGRP